MQTGVDSDGQPNVMGPPVNKLREDFPLQPECMGNLVPQQINLWMGAARNGSYLSQPAEMQTILVYLQLRFAPMPVLLQSRSQHTTLCNDAVSNDHMDAKTWLACKGQ